MANESKALAAIGNPDAAELATLSQLALMLHKSGFARRGQGGVQSAEQAAALILMGREIGLPAMQALASIHVIEGKPAASAQLIGALLARGGVTWDVRRHDATGCVIVFHRRGFADVTSAFTGEDAVRAGLAGKNVWRTYPRAMYFSRAMTEGARMIGPDLLCGIAYTPEELGAEVNADGEPVAGAPVPQVVEATVAEVAGPPPAPAAAPKKRTPALDALKRRARALANELGMSDEARKALNLRATGKESSKEWTLDDARKVNAALEIAQMDAQVPREPGDDGGHGDPLPPEFAPREPGDDDEAMAAVSAPPSAALVGKALGARGVQVSASPATPPGRAGSKRDERIAELRAMCERHGRDPSDVARRYGGGAVHALSALTDRQLELALSDAYEARDAGEGE